MKRTSLQNSFLGMHSRCKYESSKDYRKAGNLDKKTRDGSRVYFLK